MSSHPARVVVTDHAFDDLVREEETARRAGALFEVRSCVTEEETAAATRGADVVLVNLAPVTERVLAGLAPGAAVIRYGTGYDNVDVEAAARLGVAVSVIPAYGTESVAEHAVGLLLALARRIPAYDREVREAGWCLPSRFGRVPGLSAMTVGLVGVGRIGLAVIDRLIPFGCRIVAHDPFIAPASLESRGVTLESLAAVLAESDAVSLHLPLGDQTRGIIGARELAGMRPGSLLVNTSRGGLVDEQALAAALESGPLDGAALDVFESEPLGAESPLRRLPGVILTPHVAFYSEQSTAVLQQSVADEMGRALAGSELEGALTVATPA